MALIARTSLSGSCTGGLSLSAATTPPSGGTLFAGACTVGPLLGSCTGGLSLSPAPPALGRCERPT